MRKLLVAISFVLICLVSFTEIGAKQRTSKSVRQQQRLTEQKIKQTDAQIKENARKLKSKVNDYNRLRAESQAISRSIAQLKASMDSLEVQTREATDSIAVLDSRLTELQDVYADILRDTRRSRMSMNELAFIFSSKSFSQAFRRANALKQFSRWRQRKVDQINDLKVQLDERRRHLDTLMVQNRELSMRMSLRRGELQQRANEADKIVVSLKGKDKELKKMLREQQRKADALDRELDKIIKEEQRKALIEEQKRKKREEEQRRKEEEARRKASERDKSGKKDEPKDVKPDKSTPDKQSKPESAESSKSVPAKLSSNFAANKGKLSYPVNPHNIVKRFGRQRHPLHKNVMTDNAGIDMETTSGASVKCVFDGEVSAIFCPDGYNNVVLVRHGKYLTVYANLGTLAVRTGDKVKTGQSLGTVYVDTADNNRSILHFEIRNAVNPKSVTKENPEVWLR